MTNNTYTKLTFIPSKAHDQEFSMNNEYFLTTFKNGILGITSKEQNSANGTHFYRLKSISNEKFGSTEELNQEIIISKQFAELSKKPLKHFLGLDSKKYKNDFELNRAIEEYLDFFKEQRMFFKEELEFITSYKGYGGLEKFGASKKDKGLLHEYYTPTLLIKKMWALAYKYGFISGKVLEPSCGIGSFLEFCSLDNQIISYEINPYSQRVNALLYSENHSSFIAPFESHFYSGNIFKGVKEDFDLVIGNPPYGKLTGRYAFHEGKRTKTKRYEHYFIQRGIDVLKRGGLLVYVVPFNLFKESSKTFTQNLFEKCELLDAYRLPSNLFKRTLLDLAVIVLKKK